MTLARQLSEALREGERLREWHVQNALVKMSIDPQSEVGKFVVAEFRPQWEAGLGVRYTDVCNPEAVFEFLTELVE